MNLKLLITEIADKWTRENFRKIQDYLRDVAVLRGEFSFFTIAVTATTTSRDYTHNLGFRPKDVITLSVSGGYDVVWDYDNFTATTVRFSTSGPCTIRAYIGRHEEG